MSPVHYHNATPLRTLALSAMTTLKACIDAAAFIRAPMPQCCMLLLTVFTTFPSTGLQRASASSVHN
eukprot:4171504-Pleurochrysis_carterae.AAC.1